MYRVFLEEELPGMLEDIPLTLRRDVWFQHSRAAAHFIHQVLEHFTPTTSGLNGAACGLASQVTGPHTNGLLPVGSH
jgi:hypothetical protein